MAPTCSAREGPRATYDDAVAVLEDAAQIPAYPLAQDVAIEKILAALAATRDGLATRPRRSPRESALERDHHAGVRMGKGALAQVSHTVH